MRKIFVSSLAILILSFPIFAQENIASKSVIIKSKENIKRFLKYEMVEFDKIWIPKSINWQDIKQSLQAYLQQKINTVDNAWEKECYSFMKENLKNYKKEFCGFTKNNKNYLFCSMYIISMAPKESTGQNFTLIEDGGSGVVRFIYDIENKQIIKLEWNFEA